MKKMPPKVWKIRYFIRLVSFILDGDASCRKPLRHGPVYYYSLFRIPAVKMWRINKIKQYDITRMKSILV